MNVLAVDVGGTKVLVAAGNENGEIFKKERFPTPGNQEEFLKGLIEHAEKFMSSYEIEAIGVSCAGNVDFESGVVNFSPNLPEWRDVRIADVLKEIFKLPVFVDNDCNASVLAEYTFGENRGRDPLIYLTVSTGIGGGLIKDGEIYRGFMGEHQEMGHQMIEPTVNYGKRSLRYRCSCGSYNCLEAVASGTAIKNIYGKRPEDIEDDRIWREVGENLGKGIYNIAVMYAPEVIVLGGGVINGRGEMLVDYVKEFLEGNLKVIKKVPEVRKTALGNDIGILGAIALVNHYKNGNKVDYL